MGGRDLSCSGSKQRSRGRWAAQHCSSLCMPWRGSWLRRSPSPPSCPRRSRRAYRPRRPSARSTSTPFSSRWRSGISRSPARNPRSFWVSRGCSSISICQPALADARFGAAVAELVSQSEARKKPAAGAAPPGFDDLDPGVKLELLTKLYGREIGNSPKYPDTLTEGRQKSEVIPAKIEFLTAALRGHWTAGPDE